MSYLVLSRKYRPRTFDEVVGQDHITATLKKAIESGRVAQAYIFAGTRGTGKTTMARIFAKALNCVNGPTPTPCNECEICKSVDTGEDVDVIEIDGASHNLVDDVRELRANAGYRPARARFKIYYIDEVHMLTPSAFNALLKTLEEPPSHVKFIFATTEPHKIPLTIQSRCQRFDFRNIPAAGILARLGWICGKEGIEAEEGALSLVARLAAGSMRDAESLLDQIVSFSGGEISRHAVEEVLGIVPTEAFSALFGALVSGDTAAALEGVERVLSRGTAARQFVAEFIDYLRDVLVASECGADSALLTRSAAEREILQADAPRWSEEALVYAMQLLSETYARMGRLSQPRGMLDVSIVKLSHTDDFVRLKGFLSDLRSGRISGKPRKEAAEALLFEAPVGVPGKQRGGGVPDGVLAAVMEEAKARGNLVAATLQQHASFDLDEDVLKVLLPARFDIQKAHIEKQEVRLALETAASKALGRSVRLDVVCENRADAAIGGQKAAGKGGLRQKALADPAVRNVLETFGGSLIDVEE